MMLVDTPLLENVSNHPAFSAVMTGKSTVLRFVPPKLLRLLSPPKYFVLSLNYFVMSPPNYFVFPIFFVLSPNNYYAQTEKAQVKARTSISRRCANGDSC